MEYNQKKEKENLRFEESTLDDFVLGINNLK